MDSNFPVWKFTERNHPKLTRASHRTFIITHHTEFVIPRVLAMKRRPRNRRHLVQHQGYHHRWTKAPTCQGYQQSKHDGVSAYLSCHCSEKRSNLFCLGLNQKIRPEMQSNTRMMAMPSTISLPMLPNNSPL